jgi:nicotinamide-nucleotide adenylyltransferase
VWVAHVESMVPPFAKVYTNNPLTKRLFMEEGYRIVAAPLFNREEYSGTEVRRRMITGKEWGHLVPDAVRSVIADIDGEQRLRDLMEGPGW